MNVLSTKSVVAVVIVAVILWWLLRASPHKAVVGDVELGDPIVVASDASAQAGKSDYYTSSTPGDFN